MGGSYGRGRWPARPTLADRLFDLAPTVAAYLGIKPPSGATGNPLAEVLE